ncbi:ABC transporter ATP-binding protein [Sinorhizobium medicae]|uniref:ABC transporter ATP-binding protein n=1 Tax=Sinorhizobium medicae TaxID=110321 RepID=UPI000FDB44F3|nr:ABC transporter ATP-binding protein [Sinorhizobium medicae]MDX1206397.1 ATP-binding cassette domain-containing protein [Sinorhizobium medicae]RVI92592.1 ABC transporter ATP-binding protein [Sinorhizobium medicae]
MSGRQLLLMDGIHKRFGPLIVSAGVTLDIEENEIHALLGENGAGKTVLMSIICGVLSPDEGQIIFKGQALKPGSPRQAIKHRIGMVHQHFMLVPNLTVAENYVLGQGSPFSVIRDMKTVHARIVELSDRYGLGVKPDALISDLSVGEQQRVEILKVLYHGVELLILDEPTAVLTPQETDRLLHLLRRLVEDGKTVIFISHKLDEVIRVSDRVSVMRDAKVVRTVKTSETNARELARMMVGRDVLMDLPRALIEPGRVVLSVEHLNCDGESGLPALHGVSFQVRANEIVGIAGVSGNGQSELALALTGLLPIASGSVTLEGAELVGRSSHDINQMPIAHIPEDRHRMGIVLPLPLTENVILQRFDKPPFSSRGMLDMSEITRQTRDLMRRFQVKASGPGDRIQNLSGGNQQKLVVGRELDRRFDFLLINQLTRGIDIGATELVMHKILEQRSAGKAILLISTELEELFTLCDRILVMYEGHLVGEMPPDRGRLEEIGLLMAGKSPMSVA